MKLELADYGVGESTASLSNNLGVCGITWSRILLYANVLRLRPSGCHLLCYLLQSKDSYLSCAEHAVLRWAV